MMAKRTPGIIGSDWANTLVGVAVVLTPWATGENQVGPYWTCVVVGLLVAGFALWNLLALSGARLRYVVSTSSVNLFGGLWLIAFPFFADTNMAFRLACVIEGIVLLVMSGYVAWAAGRIRGAVARRA